MRKASASCKLRVTYSSGNSRSILTTTQISYIVINIIAANEPRLKNQYKPVEVGKNAVISEINNNPINNEPPIIPKGLRFALEKRATKYITPNKSRAIPNPIPNVALSTSKTYGESIIPKLAVYKI